MSSKTTNGPSSLNIKTSNKNSSDRHFFDSKNSKKIKLSSPPSTGITNQNFKVKKKTNFVVFLSKTKIFYS
jgi:hypothetical protein